MLLEEEQIGSALMDVKPDCEDPVEDIVAGAVAGAEWLQECTRPSLSGCRAEGRSSRHTPSAQMMAELPPGLTGCTTYSSQYRA